MLCIKDFLTSITDEDLPLEQMEIFVRKRFSLLFVLISTLFLCNGCSTLRWERHVRLSCDRCHDSEPKKGSPALKNKENPSLECRKCHKYNVDGDHHPTDPDNEIVGDKCATVDPDFPLVAGRMECLTCHQMHSEEVYYSGTKYFLRGGPYQDRREICFRCHNKDSYANSNPHMEMIGKEGGLNFATCLVCHVVPPNPKVDTSKTVKFRASVAFLCWRCHPPMMAQFLDNHFLRKPKDATFEEMLKGEIDHRVILPLDSKGRVTCSTCHNPHQPGVMVTESAKKGAGSEKKLRDQNICVVCHIQKSP